MSNKTTRAEQLVAQFKTQPKPEPTLAQYIAMWIEEEYIRQNVMDIPMEISSYMIQNAIDAYMGGAR
jgi:hypothetical protein